jgi:hypothetical protein
MQIYVSHSLTKKRRDFRLLLQSICELCFSGLLPSEYANEHSTGEQSELNIVRTVTGAVYSGCIASQACSVP